MTKRSSKLSVVELYAGTGRSCEPFREWNRVGGLTLIDNSEFAVATHRANFPRDKYLRADLLGLSPNEVARAAGGRVDVLLGCPPCQGFSDTGKRDANDPRNFHITKFGELALALRPLALAMENVPLAAASSRFGRLVDRLSAAGYQWTAGIANAALCGSAQSRQRLVLVALRRDVGVHPTFPKPSHGGGGRYFDYGALELRYLSEARMAILGETPAKFQTAGALPARLDIPGALAMPTVGAVLGGLPRLGSAAARTLSHEPFVHSAAMLRRMRTVPEGGRWAGGKDHFSHAYGRLHRRGLARTITTFFGNAGSGRFWHPTQNRALTIREAARVQGFPDEYRFQPLNSLNNARLVGNALDAALARLTYGIIRRALE